MKTLANFWEWFPEKAIRVITSLLIGLSVIALILAIIQGFFLPPASDWSPSGWGRGFQNYLKVFEPYHALFAATFGAILALEAFKRLRLMAKANQNAYKASNRTIWIQTIKEFFPDVAKENPEMVRRFSKDILSLHDYFFEKDYIFSSEADVKGLFDAFFKNHVGVWEEKNSRFQRMVCYPDEKGSYSWEGFRLLISAMIKEDGFVGFWEYLRHLYQERVVDFIKANHHVVDPKVYQSNFEAYIISKSI
jgi:hypothetical protein